MRKYVVKLITLIILITLCGCARNKEESASIGFESDSEMEESSSIESEEGSNEEDSVRGDLGSNVYFISKEDEFYRKIADNPIDASYIIDYEAPVMQIYIDLLKKCDVWNKQIDYTLVSLENKLDESTYNELKETVELWHEYYQEEREMNPSIYGWGGLIPGSMYTPISADILNEKTKYFSTILLSIEYEISNDVSFIEQEVPNSKNVEYSIGPWLFCAEYTSDFESSIEEYLIENMSNDNLETLINKKAESIEKSLGKEFSKHVNKCLSILERIYDIESIVLQDEEQCRIIGDNRLRLIVTELLNIEYLINMSAY